MNNEHEKPGVDIDERAGTGVALRTGPDDGQVEWFDYNKKEVPSVKTIA